MRPRVQPLQYSHLKKKNSELKHLEIITCYSKPQFEDLKLMLLRLAESRRKKLTLIH
jgi:hypothetical protein